jgi:hypothetical protein
MCSEEAYIMSFSKTLTSLAGEYLVAAQLCMQGFGATLTLKNYPGVDVFAHNPENGKRCGIQVKTTWVAPSQGYWMPDPARIKSDGTPFVFVHLNKKGPPEFFVLTTSQLAPWVKSEKKYWYVNIRDLLIYKDQWCNLGL